MPEERNKRYLVYLLGATCFFQNGAIGLIVARFADQELGLSVASIGVALAARSLGPVFFGASLGGWGTRIGLRRSLTLATALTAVSGVLYLFTHSYVMLLVAQLLGGLFYLSSWIGAQTYATGLADRDTALGVFSTFTAVGMAVAPLVVGLTYDFAGYRAAFLMYIFGSVVQLFIVRRLPEMPMGAAGSRGGQTRDMGRSLVAILSRPGIQTAFIFSFICLFAINARMTFVPVYFQQAGYSASLIGLILSAGSIGQAALRPFTKNVLHALGLTGLLVAASIVGIVGLFALPFLGGLTWLMPLVAFLHGGGAGLHQSIGLMMVAEHTMESERGLAVGLRATVNQLSGTAAPAVLGALAQIWGLALSFLATALALVGLVGFMAVRANSAAAESGVARETQTRSV